MHCKLFSWTWRSYTRVCENNTCFIDIRVIIKWWYGITWIHNERDGVSNHLCLDCSLNRFFRARSKKTSKLHVTGLCDKGVVTRKMFPFDDVIMENCITPSSCQSKLACHGYCWNPTAKRSIYIHHDDVIKYKHFPRHWPFVRGIHGHRWIPHTKTSDAELWCFLLFMPW